MSPEVLAYLCILLGVLVRMLIPALRKYGEAMEEGEEFHWDNKYTVTAIVSVLVGLATAAIGFDLFTVPDTYNFSLVVGTIVYGFGLDAVITEVSEWM